jgi:hypothetical protein
MQNKPVSPYVPTNVERLLLRPGTLEKVRDHLTLAGFAETSAALLSDVMTHAPYVERCSREADACCAAILAPPRGSGSC